MKKLLLSVLVVLCIVFMFVSCSKPKHNLTVELVVEPTCTSMGYTEYGCEHCDEAYVDNFVSALGHTYGEGVAIIKEDCTTRGVYESTCVRCGEAHRYSVNPNGHSYVEISSDGTTVDYQCEVCLDVVNIASDDRIENYIGVIEIFDVEPNFSFQILSNADESYIRENLKIIDSYFNGTEYENDAEVIQAYNLTDNGGGLWTVSAVVGYEYDVTYLAKLTGELAFNNYKGNELSFTVMGDPNHENSYAYKDGVLFLKTLENTNGGYYPYEVRNASEGGIYLVVSKIDGLSKGQILCIGDVESLDDITSDTECYFGIVGDAYPLSNGQYAVMLAEPELQGIFDDLDIAFTDDVDLSGVDLDVTEFENNVVDALYSNEEFVEFLSSVKVASDNYLEANGYYSPNLVDTETFLNSVEITPNVSVNGNSLEIHLDGVITLDINNDGGEKIGTLKIEFSFDMESQFKIDVNYDIKTKWSGIKLERFDVAMTQSDAISFDFHVSVDSDKIGTSGYVINRNTGEAHLSCCVEVTRASDPSVFEKVSFEDMQGANIKCTHCKPENGSSLENDFNGYYVNTLYCSDWEKVASDIEKLTKMDKNRTKVKVEIGSVEIPICGPVGVNISLNFALSFDVRAVMGYSYTYSQRNVYGMRLNHGYVQPYSQMTTGDMNRNDLSVLGTVDARVGLSVDSRVTISGFEKWINAGISAEVGSYAELSGVLDSDKEYYGAYLEIGAYLDIDASYKLIKNSGSSDLAEIKRALAKYGYEKLYFAYETYYDSIKIECSYDIDANNLLAVKYYDLVNMVINTDELSLSGNSNYRVTLSLADGTYCQIKDGVIVSKAGAPEVFNDTLIVTVTSNGSWKNYRKGSALYYLGEYRVDFEFDTKHTHEWVEATCTTPKTCADCGVKEGAALGHDFANYVDDGNATCTTDGTQTATCSICSATDTKVILGSATGHDWAEATCLVRQTCKDCGISIGSTVRHDLTIPTCIVKATCQVCGVSVGDYGEHTGGEWIVDKDHSALEDGLKHIECIYCGATIKEEIIPMTPNLSEGLSYKLNSDGNSYTVTGIGTCEDTDLVIPSTYNGKFVTAIGSYAFERSYTFTSVVIPGTVKVIGERAFTDSDLLEHVIINDGVEVIGNYAFMGCDSLLGIIMYNSIKSIGNQAMNACENLRAICYFGTRQEWNSISKGSSWNKNSPCTLYNYDEPTTSNDAVVYDGVEYTYNSYLNCYRVSGLVVSPYTDIVIRDEIDGIPVTEIGSLSAPVPERITSIAIPDSIEVVNIYNDFEGIANKYNNCYYMGNENNPYLVLVGTNEGVDTVIVHEDTKVISRYAFNSCISTIKNVIISDSVHSIPEQLFYGCTSLESLTIGNSVTSIGDSAFYGCTALTSIVIPDSVTHIWRNAFRGCTSITSIDIPNSVIYIYDYAFEGCTSLASIEMGDSVTNIEQFAFSNCTSITKIEIPDSVTFIGYYAFSGCTSLTIYCEAASIPVRWDHEWNLLYHLNNGYVSNKYYVPVVWGYKSE